MTFRGTEEQLINALHETAERLTGAKAAICTAAAEQLSAFGRIVAAHKAHVDAVSAYNARHALAQSERARGNWSIKLDAEMLRIASDMGEPEDPFAAWESIELIKSQRDQLRKALVDMVPPKLTWKERDADGFLIHHQVSAINAARAALADYEAFDRLSSRLRYALNYEARAPFSAIEAEELLAEGWTEKKILETVCLPKSSLMTSPTSSTKATSRPLSLPRSLRRSALSRSIWTLKP